MVRSKRPRVLAENELRVNAVGEELPNYVDEKLLVAARTELNNGGSVEINSSHAM